MSLWAVAVAALVQLFAAAPASCNMKESESIPQIGRQESYGAAVAFQALLLRLEDRATERRKGWRRRESRRRELGWNGARKRSIGGDCQHDRVHRRSI